MQVLASSHTSFAPAMRPLPRRLLQQTVSPLTIVSTPDQLIAALERGDPRIEIQAHLDFSVSGLGHLGRIKHNTASITVRFRCFYNILMEPCMYCLHHSCTSTFTYSHNSIAPVLFCFRHQPLLLLLRNVSTTSIRARLHFWDENDWSAPVCRATVFPHHSPQRCHSSLTCQDAVC